MIKHSGSDDTEPRVTKAKDYLKKDKPIKKNRTQKKPQNPQPQLQFPSNHPHQLSHNQTLQQILFTFLEEIEQRDLMFDSTTRTTLSYICKQISPQPIKIDSQNVYDQAKATKLVETLLEKLNLHQQTQLQNIASQAIPKLKSEFIDQANFFASEVFPELYDILLTVTSIVLQNQADLEALSEELKKFGNLIPSVTNENQLDQKFQKQRFFFFGFHMFKLPAGKTEEDIKNLTKHHPEMRYILMEKYRKPNGPYANLMLRLGERITEILFEKKKIQLLIQQ